jgi:hypothetical protein
VASFERSFRMSEDPKAAQARFSSEIGPALHRMGFRLDVEQPGHLAFGARYMGGFLFLGWVTGAFWLWRKLMRHRVEVEFNADASGTMVELYGRTGGGMRDLINLLGRHGHWPETLDDRDWIPALPDDRLREWNSADELDPQQMDRITRRALKKAGRLPK